MKSEGWLLFGAMVILALLGGGLAVSTVPGASDSLVTKLAQAIAAAEGFFLAGSKSSRNNNPGDIESNGQIVSYPTIGDGWQALYNQVHLMLYGGSAHYDPSMTIAQVGYIYADGAHDPTGAQNWSANVANALGVTTDTTLQNLIDMEGSTA